MTGLGTPVANLLVPDLVAYQGPGTTYSGPTVGPLQNATLVNTGTSSGGPIDVFSVFDSFTVARNRVGHVEAMGTSSTNHAILKSVAPRIRAAAQWKTVAAPSRPPTPATTSQGLMALDEVIMNWTPASNSTMKRLTPSTAVGGVSVDLVRGRVLPAASMSAGNPVLQAETVDVIMAEYHMVQTLPTCKSQMQ